MKQKTLICHTDLVMNTGEIAAIKGKEYPVIDETNKNYEFTSELYNCHIYPKYEYKEIFYLKGEEPQPSRIQEIINELKQLTGASEIQIIVK